MNIAGQNRHNWGLSLEANGWVDQIKHILKYTDMKEGPIIDIDAAGSRMIKLNRNIWKLEGNSKPKLRTFLEVQDDNYRKTLVNVKLSRSQKSFVPKLKLSILPRQIEVGR